MNSDLKRTLASTLCRSLVWTLALATATAQGPGGPELNVVHYKAPEFPVAGPVSDESALPSSSRQGQVQAPAPSAPSTEWINSSPLTMSGLHGKVVLIDFWEYTCINCIRTFAENKKWYERYHRYGFEIIGVHDPEFDIAYSAENVRAAVKRFGLPYPVVVDVGFQIWKAYNNSTWPNRFLIDAKGFVRFNRPGEGGDSAFEHAIQQLLQEAHPGLHFSAEYTITPEQNAFAPSCGVPTEEMYVGDWSGRGVLANSEGYHQGKTLNYELPGSVEDGRAAVSGRWEADKNGMIYRGKNKESERADKLVMRYHARELYAVLNVSHGKPSRLYIKQDGKDLAATDKGVDVQFDSGGHSYIEVREPRMYYLVQNPSFGSHAVELIPSRAGLTVNSFTFGNDCQTQFPHL
jgi:thiol-disulfide isomerase/thioredoxin